MNKEILRYAKVGLLEYIRYEIWQILQTDTSIDAYKFIYIENSRKKISDFLIESTTKHLKIDKIIKKYVEYLDEILTKINLPNDNEHSKLFINITMPQLSKAIIRSIKSKSRFHLFKSDMDLINAFRDGLVRVDKDLSRKNQSVITEKMALEEMEDIMTSETLSDHLVSVFGNYEAIGYIYIGKLDKAKEIIMSMKKDKDIGISFIMEQGRINRGLVEKINMLNPAKKDKTRLETTKKIQNKNDLIKKIQGISNYKNLSIRKIAAALEYKSDSGYTHILDTLSLPHDFHKTI